MPGPLQHHVITVVHFIPLSFSLTGGYRYDVTHLVPLISAIPPYAASALLAIGLVYSDRGYDHY